MRNSAVKGGRPPKEAAGDPCSASQTTESITIMCTAGAGVLVDASVATKLSGITQNSFGKTGTYGMRLIGGSSATVSGSRFEGNTYGLHADPGTFATVGNSGFRENTYGVYADTGSFVTAAHSVISANTVNGALIFGGGGGAHSFQSCQISGNGITGGYGASGIRVAYSGATVTIGSSNLSGNGPLNGLLPGDTNLDADPWPAHSINASGNYWGLDIYPRSAEASAADVSSPQLSECVVLNTLYGEPVLWDYPFDNNINEIFIGNGHVNYKAEPASYDLEPHKTKYARLVYPATGIWNGYKPGVIRETNGNDALVVEIFDYEDRLPGADRAVTTASKPGTIKLNIAVMDQRADLHNMSTIAHEFGHCLGLYENNDAPDNIMTQGRNSDIPLVS